MTTLPKTFFDEIERHGRDAYHYPEECVGALIGTVAAGGTARTVQRLFPIDNRSGDNRKRRYLVSPLDYLAAERAADSRQHPARLLPLASLSTRPSRAPPISTWRNRTSSTSSCRSGGAGRRTRETLRPQPPAPAPSCSIPTAPASSPTNWSSNRTAVTLAEYLA